MHGILQPACNILPRTSPDPVGLRKPKRRIPLWTWIGVGFLVLVLLGCVITIIYVNSVEEAAPGGQGSWVVVLGGTVEGGGHTRELHVLNMGGCTSGAPRLHPLPREMLASSLVASYVPSLGLLVCSSSSSSSCTLLASGAEDWVPYPVGREARREVRMEGGREGGAVVTVEGELYSIGGAG